jgi:hypothetical protein
MLVAYICLNILGTTRGTAEVQWMHAWFTAVALRLQRIWLYASICFQRFKTAVKTEKRLPLLFNNLLYSVPVNRESFPNYKNTFRLQRIRVYGA